MALPNWETVRVHYVHCMEFEYGVHSMPCPCEPSLRIVPFCPLHSSVSRNPSEDDIGQSIFFRMTIRCWWHRMTCESILISDCDTS